MESNPEEKSARLESALESCTQWTSKAIENENWEESKAWSALAQVYATTLIYEHLSKELYGFAFH